MWKWIKSFFTKTIIPELKKPENQKKIEEAINQIKK